MSWPSTPCITATLIASLTPYKVCEVSVSCSQILDPERCMLQDGSQRSRCSPASPTRAAPGFQASGTAKAVRACTQALPTQGSHAKGSCRDEATNGKLHVAEPKHKEDACPCKGFSLSNSRKRWLSCLTMITFCAAATISARTHASRSYASLPLCDPTILSR